MKRATIKHTLIYLLPALILCFDGCIKTQRDPEKYLADKGYPLGTFEGNCVKLHRKTVYYQFDTLKVNLRLTLSTNTGYNITGDTTTWHAGSYGSFSEDFVNMVFDDVTNPSASAAKRPIYRAFTHMTMTVPHSSLLRGPAG
ncbi:hypothetical protein [Mucilaginibacter antarcticus]|uniref:hypothetical protein n=1 Tax=Mucilaginibacter antarcticus TaxID=1855725 RepID=UPI0036414E2B